MPGPPEIETTPATMGKKAVLEMAVSQAPVVDDETQPIQTSPVTGPDDPPHPAEKPAEDTDEASEKSLRIVRTKFR